MRLELEVSLDPTLGCGQAHRWRKEGDVWTGVLGRDVVRMRQTEYGAEVEGCSDLSRLRDYFRAEDDLAGIVADISSRDEYVASLSAHCPGLRILRQPHWECLATYLLATNANVARIGKMVESLDYERCVEELIGIKGVGPKVADCVALFAYGHLEAFPVDARIQKSMEELYGVTGSYKVVSRYGREKFGRYAGYAQEFLYHREFIE